MPCVNVLAVSIDPRTSLLDVGSKTSDFLLDTGAIDVIGRALDGVVLKIPGLLNQEDHSELPVDACHPSLMKEAVLISESLLMPRPPSAFGRVTVAQLT